LFENFDDFIGKMLGDIGSKLPCGLSCLENRIGNFALLKRRNAFIALDNLCENGCFYLMQLNWSY
jgi:hypothetical protein